MNIPINQNDITFNQYIIGRSKKAIKYGDFGELSLLLSDASSRRVIVRNNGDYGFIINCCIENCNEEFLLLVTKRLIMQDLKVTRRQMENYFNFALDNNLTTIWKYLMDKKCIDRKIMDESIYRLCKYNNHKNRYLIVDILKHNNRNYENALKNDPKINVSQYASLLNIIDVSEHLRPSEKKCNPRHF